MPRVAQVFEQHQKQNLGPSSGALSDAKMPDSSAGDSPVKPVRAGITPRCLLFGGREGVRPQDDNHSESENDIKPKQTFIRPSGGTPKSVKFAPKPGGLAEAVLETTTNRKSISPLQRSSKWLKADIKDLKADTETRLPTPSNSNRFYSRTNHSPRVGALSERDLNIKVNKTGSTFSTPKSKRDEFQFPTVDDVETDGTGDRQPEVIELDADNTNQANEVAVPEKFLEPHQVGLQNRGNTCYLNSTVQALLGLPMLVTDATNLKHAVNKLSVNMDNTKLVLPFTSLCQAQAQGDVTKTNQKAVEVKSDMEQLDSQFAGHKMQDANEFLCRFMDELRENIGKVLSENGDGNELQVEDDSGSNHTLTNLVDKNFQYEKQEQFVCCNCGHQSSTKYTDVNFFLDLSDASLNSSVSIQQLVEKTLAPEVREKRCEECGCETATTTTSLVSLPRVMLLYLKRYKYLGPVGGGTITTSSRKVTRLVDIPKAVNLEKLVSDNVDVPDSFLSDSLSINTNPESEENGFVSADTTQQPPSTPVKSAAIALPYEGVGTPIKFKGKTEEELAKLSEEEQTEYLLYISQKEALTSNGRDVVLVNEDEDEDLKAALEASLLDVGDCNPGQSGYESDHEQKENVSSPATGEFKTPPRKRHHSVTSSDAGETPPAKTPRLSGVFTHSSESLSKREATPTRTEPSNEKSSPSSEKKQSWKKSFHRPETKAEEEADMLRALELSTQDLSSRFDEAEEDAGQVVPESTEVNNDDCDDNEEVVTGPPEFSYKLTSIVSHFGASTAAGHYVADVYRFDAGGWFRYDDTVVTQTNETSVRKGSNRANGYIFMYVHQPLWEQCNVKHNKNLNNNNIDPLLCDSSINV